MNAHLFYFQLLKVNLHNLINQVYLQFQRCRCKYKLDQYETLCKNGNLLAVKELYNLYFIDLNLGLNLATEFNHVHLARFLIEKGANNINDNLAQACKKNYAELAELLIQKGGNLLVAKRNTTSTNILKMIYYYGQNSELKK
jgi:ankyrin repeat protein